jgi:hypothetical protein
MAIEQKSGNSSDLQTVDPISKAARVTLYASDGHEGTHSLPVLLVGNEATALNEFVLSGLDASDYKFISFQLTGIWVGEVTFEGSNDNTTFYSIATTDPSGSNTGQTTATTNHIVKVPVLTKYIRARVSAYTSGTISAVIYGHIDENSSGLISTLGTMTLQPETTKKIGNVGLEAGANVIGSLDNVAKLGGAAISMGSGAVDAGTQRVVLAPATDPLQTDFYVTGVGAVDVNSRMIRTGACELIAAIFTSYAATPRHIKLYDTATAPVAGVGIPVLVLTRAASGNNAYPLPAGGFPFVNGIGMTFVQGAANNNAVGTATVDGSLTSIFT